ncbi:MAG: plastocyanin/azurin family copper-binding protein [Solirubrobacteraceae bacterium]
MRILLTIPLTALLIGCGSSSSNDTAGTTPAPATPSAAKTVKIADFKFGAPLTVAKGAKVTFENTDSAPHNAVGDGFKTKDLKKGESDTLTFDKAGTYDYMCTFHPFMKGTVVVQ